MISKESRETAVAGTKLAVRPILKEEAQPPNWQCPKGHSEFDIVT